ncbi:pyrophosphorylase [Frankia sp. R82]|uniref:pyrophosphorylase n=1 Tax=Frankia sp. R82 TaxID=2950553 RepID=UPI002044436A|nr:pyrophosphorylase [Frankia sp. R82]MCM3884666.1 pyrophosphorylase [Frankia sp. R82]
MRTVTTPAAMQAASRMSQTLPELQRTATDLIAHGTTLADPRNWEGPKAQIFRGQIWPEVQRALTDLHANLTELTQGITEINRRTVEAGS